MDSAGAPELKLRHMSTDGDGVMESSVPHFAIGDAALAIPRGGTAQA